MNEQFPSMRTTEAVVLTFDFAPGLDTGETLTGAIQVSVSMGFGVDAEPQQVLNGAAVFDASGRMVLLPVRGRVDRCDYRLAVTASTTNPQKILTAVGILPVRDN